MEGLVPFVGVVVFFCYLGIITGRLAAKMGGLCKHGTIVKDGLCG